MPGTPLWQYRARTAHLEPKGMHIRFICQILLRNHEQCKAGVSPIQNLFHCFPSGAMIQPFGMAQDIKLQ